VRAAVSARSRLDDATYREALIHAARHLALCRDDVIRLTEVLNARSWEECGPAEIAVVIQRLRDVVQRCLSQRDQVGGGLRESFNDY
jgi:hypothetical protein